MKNLPVTTTFDIQGYQIDEYLGIVRGIIVRNPTIVQGVLGGVKSLIGGKIPEYIQMCEQTRSQSFDEMIKHAVELGADAVVGFRYDASDVADNSTEVLCYGTAVKLIKT